MDTVKNFLRSSDIETIFLFPREQAHYDNDNDVLGDISFLVIVAYSTIIFSRVESTFGQFFSGM